MYAFIEGRVCEKTTNSLVLEAGGIGYQLNCSMTTLQEAPPMGEKMRCYTYLSVREDAMELFGFATKEEKQLFLSLTGISGVGAKTALGLLGARVERVHVRMEDHAMRACWPPPLRHRFRPSAHPRKHRRLTLHITARTYVRTMPSHAQANRPWSFGNEKRVLARLYMIAEPGGSARKWAMATLRSPSSAPPPVARPGPRRDSLRADRTERLTACFSEARWVRDPLRVRCRRPDGWNRSPSGARSWHRRLQPS